MTPKRSEAVKVLETIAHRRCPCGHLDRRHRKPSDKFPGEVMGACRDCECRGFFDWSEHEARESPFDREFGEPIW